VGWHHRSTLGKLPYHWIGDYYLRILSNSKILALDDCVIAGDAKVDEPSCIKDALNPIDRS
jgi:hypothetical protein